MLIQRLKKEAISSVEHSPTRLGMDGIKGGREMLQEIQHPNGVKPVNQDRPIIQTTLYDLIAAVNETLNPTEDRIVTEIVMDLLNSAQARKVNPRGITVKEKLP
jgi:hypothetical protein